MEAPDGSVKRAVREMTHCTRLAHTYKFGIYTVLVRTSTLNDEETMKRTRLWRVPLALTLTPALVATGVLLPTSAALAAATTSGDASVSFDAATEAWTLETDDVRRVIDFGDGKLLQTSLVNKETGRDYQQSGISAEFRVRVDGTDLRGSSGGWSLVHHSADTEANGAIHLSIRLERPGLAVDRHYWLYPETSFIEERTDVTNTGPAAKSITDYSAISMRVLGDDAADVDMYAMNGDKASTAQYQTLKGPIPMASGLQNPGGRGGNVHQQFVTLRDRVDAEGIVATWDYTGNWVMNVGDSFGKILVEPRATIATPLATGTTITGPLGRTAFYSGDLDDMGNTVLDFTYRYLWEHTNDEFFPLIRYGGYGSSPDIIADKIRQLAYIGGDMVWMDDGWQNAMGDWHAKEGEPLEEYRDFAALHGQHVGYWLVPWGAEGTSQIAQQHPEWMLNPADRKAGLDTTLPGVVEHIDQMIQERQAQYGPFMLKTDFGADSGNMLKANATMQILENFVENNSQASLQLCSDGGGLMSLRTVALSDLALQRDGTPGREDGYWTSMLYPTEKLIASYGRGDVGKYSKSNRHLLSFHFTIAGDTTAPDEALEPLRVDAELYRYLNSKGVMGRWVKVYRPTADSGSTVGILQKMSGDGERGYITFPKDAFTLGSSVTLFPKGLDSDRVYAVAGQESSVERATKTGAEWMEDGITIDSYVEGEVVYFNLEDRPGSGTDATQPSAAPSASKATATHLGDAGVELTWKAGSDDRWLSHYAISKNGEPLTKISKGEYFFDVGGRIGDTYEIVTVDGDGNRSPAVTAEEPRERAELSGLAADIGTLSPAFSPEVEDYTLHVPGATTEVTLTPTAKHSDTVVEIDGSAVEGATGTEVSVVDGQVIRVTTTSLGGRRIDHRVTVAYDEPIDSAAPARGTLSNTSGWAHGLHDGRFEVRMDLWWGQNAREFRLFENGVLIETVPLTPNGVRAQRLSVPLEGRADGTYVYTGELRNTAGITATSSTTVRVKDAKPAKPALRVQGDGGAVTAYTDLWWGTNASSYRLIVDGTIVDQRELTAATPSAQHVATTLPTLSPGEHRVQAVMSNSAGETLSDEVTFVVP